MKCLLLLDFVNLRETTIAANGAVLDFLILQEVPKKAMLNCVNLHNVAIAAVLNFVNLQETLKRMVLENLLLSKC